MAVHLAFHMTCDRCGKPFDSKNLKFNEGLPKYEPQPVEMLRAGKQVFSFTDLCSKCEGVINNFIERIRLEDSSPKLTDKSEKPAEAEKGKSEQHRAGEDKEDPPF